tara:strand:- start:98 stop:1294 length:1197 start_codon:yes stop_codon:yes gene_type:complete
MILNELASNADSYQFSTFFHKDRNGKLRAGPIWDFNLILGNDLFEMGFDRSQTDIWQFLNGNMGSTFWTDLFEDPVFNCYLTKRWQELTAPGMPLNLTEIFNLIDATQTLISEAAARQETVSGTTGDFDQNIIEMKAFITERIQWISNELTITSLCDNITTPPLVISKINYNPLVDVSLNSSDFEFMELTNNSSSTIDLTGIYFGGLGLTYQFPEGASLPAQSVLYLSNDSESFNQRYGFEPFDEFSRSLSNDGEDLILRDAYGNSIDEVTYNDALPWPEEADGEGSFLKLVGLDLDNSLASSWIARPDTSENLSTGSRTFDSFVSLYPNPVSDILNIKTSSGTISSVKLYSINGKLFRTYSFENRQVELDLSAFENGFYLLQIQTDSELLFKKIIKN